MESNIHIRQLIEIYAELRNLSHASVGAYAVGDARLHRRLSGGGSITLSRATKFVRYVSDNWPAGAPWPQSIPRPQPSPDSPAAREAEAAAANRGSADDEALRLGADGRLADPRALARRMAPYEIQVQAYLDSYYHVVSAYADGGARAGKRPRRKSRAMEILGALIAAGDVRFASRDPGPKGRALLRSTLPARTEPLL